MDTLKMDETRVLSGGTLVRMGALKAGTSLPEVGMKEVWPNNTWLEEKQIQEALEARKLLLKAERIEKSGALSHAEWREDLKLAEVTQKVGGYWQYLGHNVGTELYLYPEEALFLLEVNCLLLKYGGMKVSFQQAYALLLQGNLTLMKYKVYASLSRLGYRVYRHTPQDENDNENGLDTEEITENTQDGKEPVSDQNKIHENEAETSPRNAETNKNESENQQVENICSNPENILDKEHERPAEPTEMDIMEVASQPSSSQHAKKSNAKRFKVAKYVANKIHQLRNRKVKPTKQTTELTNRFLEIPDFTKYPEVNMFITPRTFQPIMIFTCRSYNLNIKRMTTASKEILTSTSPNTIKSSNDDTSTAIANQQNLTSARPSNLNPYNDINFFWNDLRFPNPQLPPGPPPMMFLSPPPNFYPNLNMNFQTPFVPQPLVFPFPPRPPPPPHFVDNIPNNFNTQIRKRSHDMSKKQERMECIKHIAYWVKDAILNSKVPVYYILKLQQLMQSFNARYRTRVRFTDDFNITFEENPNENVVETVDLDDEDEQINEQTPKKKKHVNTFESKLKKIEDMADQLKALYTKNEATSKHKRMFNKLIQRFNETYKVNYYLDDNFYLIDRNDLTAYSSSSDVEEVASTSSAPITSKKLKNPFSILKQLSERQKDAEPLPSTSQSDELTNCNYSYSPHLLQAFKENWLPSKTDFGRPEIISINRAKETIDISREELIFDFVKIQPEKFENWLEVKISFYQCLQKTSEVLNDTGTEKITTLNSLTSPKDFSNPTVVLEKLRIIKSHSEIKLGNEDDENRREQESEDLDDDSEEEDPMIDFDVYFRDLKNFKKSHRPAPNFYVSCIRESRKLPSTEQIAGLHADLEAESPPLLFAVTGSGSISYIRVVPVEIGTCVPTEPTANTD